MIMHIEKKLQNLKFLTENSRNEKDWPEATDDMNELFFGEVLTETPPDGCYAVTVQDVK